MAVSLTSDPTQGWVGFTRAVGSTLNVADFDSLGFNSNSVVVTANIYTIQNGALTSTAVLSVPKANLISATTPNAASVTTAETYDSTLSDTPASYDAAVDYDTTVNEYLLAQLGTTGPELETVSGGGGPTASVTGPVTIAVSSGTLDETFPVAPPQPAGAPPLTTGPGIQTVGVPSGETGSLTDSLSNDFSGTVALVNGDLWAAQTVASGGADVIQWMEISVSGTPTVIQHGLITDVTGKGLNFYYPSLSVDSDGDVVIGFNGSSLTQQISSYAVYGTTTSGVTTFTSPSLLKQGTGIYAGLSDASPVSAALTATIPNTTTPATTFTTTGTGDSIEITVQLAAAAPAGGSTVILGFNGTAVANNDYSISSNTNAVTSLLGAPIELVIPAGLTTGSVVLTGLDNTHATDDETLNVSIVSINATAPATPQSASLTLIDPSAPFVSAENQAIVDNAGATTANIVVRLSEPVTTSVTVPYTVAGGNASASDYTGTTTGSVTFLPGQTIETIPVHLSGTVATNGEDFLVTLGTPNRGQLGPNPTATVTLISSFASPTATVALSLPSGSSFTENPGSQLDVRATLTGGPRLDTHARDLVVRRKRPGGVVRQRLQRQQRTDRDPRGGDDCGRVPLRQRHRHRVRHSQRPGRHPVGAGCDGERKCTERHAGSRHSRQRLDQRHRVSASQPQQQHDTTPRGGDRLPRRVCSQPE